jgi:hypothetical protein
MTSLGRTETAPDGNYGWRKIRSVSTGLSHIAHDNGYELLGESASQLTLDNQSFGIECAQHDMH